MARPARLSISGARTSPARKQGAGGVGGLLAVSMDGVFYIPCYDHNGNIVLYISETGATAAQYTYDPYGNIIDSSGPLADVFSFGFSTKYHDRETGMINYKLRVLRPDFGRWLNRDPIEEGGGANFIIDNEIIAPFEFMWNNTYDGLLEFDEKFARDTYIKRTLQKR